MMDIAFADRSVQLDTIDQRRTYASLLEGVPFVRFNDELIDRFVAEAARGDRHTLLVPPVRTPIASRGPVSARLSPQEALPRICCTASLLSYNVARDPEMHASSLTVIWFQETWALPIDVAVLAHLASVSWREHAWDFQW